ncbi:hypothetical protein HPP92_023548 [Vanilla planifolia]|uniref:Uncharacterized protein n=1 Tax=Vanilla planifolia TaxID=51239 RepID=A0A835PQJ2_VANPL|nr:hypothetical protein HPP92_023548 [Vanilla planifolia]
MRSCHMAKGRELLIAIGLVVINAKRFEGHPQSFLIKSNPNKKKEDYHQVGLQVAKISK